MLFRKSTEEELFTSNVSTKQCLDTNQHYVCSTDSENAFDKILHKKLEQILKNKRMIKTYVKSLICTVSTKPEYISKPKVYKK